MIPTGQSFYLVTETQKQIFKDYTGLEFPTSPFGELFTEHPYNNQEWPYDRWNVMYVYDNTNGVLSIALSHRMTNTRFHAFNHKGTELDPDIAEHYINQFEHYLDEPEHTFKPSFSGELKPYPQEAKDMFSEMQKEITKELDKQIIEELRNTK